MLSFMIHTLETMKVVINAEKMTTHWRWLSSLFLQYRYFFTRMNRKRKHLFLQKIFFFLFWTSAKFLVKKKKILMKKKSLCISDCISCWKRVMKKPHRLPSKVFMYWQWNWKSIQKLTHAPINQRTGNYTCMLQLISICLSIISFYTNEDWCGEILPIIIYFKVVIYLGHLNADGRVSEFFIVG